MNSNKYVNLTLDYIDSLYEDIAFSKLMRLRCNKDVRLYFCACDHNVEDRGFAMDAFAEQT